jgi:hypothetical protein
MPENWKRGVYAVKSAGKQGLSAGSAGGISLHAGVIWPCIPEVICAGF